MASSSELPTLYVEGSDDEHTIVHLLSRHGIYLDKHTGPVMVKRTDGSDELLRIMPDATRASTNRSVGFVVDANGAVADRWRAVCERLKEFGVLPPATAPGGGYIDGLQKLKARVGVWIMPDNETDSGRLEDLVRTLVPKDDDLFGHAMKATKQAQKSNTRFPAQDRTKAELHCWRAWQEEPGRPFGTAIKANFFRHDSDVALRFVDWFRELFLRAGDDASSNNIGI